LLEFGSVVDADMLRGRLWCKLWISPRQWH
jgi:hypothetical protein